MKYLISAGTFVFMSYAAPAFSQPPEAEPTGPVSFGQLQPTEQMWYYEQAQRQYADPRLAVRKKAEIASAQRRGRIAARKWFGLSNARPVATPMPWYRPYAPGWHGNSHDQHHWVGNDYAPIVLRPLAAVRADAIGLW